MCCRKRGHLEQRCSVESRLDYGPDFLYPIDGEDVVVLDREVDYQCVGPPIH